MPERIIPDPSNEAAEQAAGPQPAMGSLGRVPALASLVGAHPLALADLYATGIVPAAELLAGDRVGKVLGVSSGEAHMLVRPVVELLGRLPPLWRGKSFASDARAGRNLLGPWRPLPFRAEVGPSLLDGAPTLQLRYDGLGNPWPLSLVVDELRQIDRTVAIGPFCLRTGSELARLGWWGLELAPS